MNALAFLGIAVGLSLFGCLVLWLRSRQPGSMDAHIRDFARELEALAPGSPLDRQRGRAEPGARPGASPPAPPVPPAPMPPEPRAGRRPEPGTGPPSG